MSVSTGLWLFPETWEVDVRHIIIQMLNFSVWFCVDCWISHMHDLPFKVFAYKEWPKIPLFELMIVILLLYGISSCRICLIKALSTIIPSCHRWLLISWIFWRNLIHLSFFYYKAFMHHLICNRVLIERAHGVTSLI